MTGSNHIRTPNEPNGLELWFYFKKSSEEKAIITVEDIEGEQVFRQELNAVRGPRKIYWNTMRALPGEYSVRMTFEGKTITQKGIVEEKLLWPVLNYRE
jgi:hypothetical protein